MTTEKKRLTCANGHKEKVLATFARGGDLSDSLAPYSPGGELYERMGAEAAENTRQQSGMLGDWEVLQWDTMQSVATDSAGEYDDRRVAARRERAAQAMLHEGARPPAQRVRFALECPVCGLRKVWKSERVQAFLDSDLTSFCISPGAS